MIKIFFLCLVLSFYIYFSLVKYRQENFNIEVSNTDIPRSIIKIKDNNNKNNYGILKNISSPFYSKNEYEITIKELEVILNRLKELNFNKNRIVTDNYTTNFSDEKKYDKDFISLNPNIDMFFQEIKKWLFSSINCIITDFLALKCKKVIIYTLEDLNMINIKSNNNYINYKFTCFLYNKKYNSKNNIYFDIIISKKNKQKIVSNVRIMGTENSTRFKNLSSKNDCFIDNKYCILKPECENECNKTIYNKNNIQLFKSDIEKEDYNNKLNSLYKCYKKTKNDEYLNYNKIDCEKNDGI